MKYMKKMPEINWPEAIKPLLKKYKNTPHPLEAQNLYQMLVMVVLSAQTTDNIVWKRCLQKNGTQGWRCLSWGGKFAGRSRM